MNVIFCMILIGASQGLRLGLRLVEHEFEETKNHADTMENKTQAAKCEGIRPLASCMMGMYNWGLVWLHGLGNGKSSQYYETVMIPQILAVTGMPPGSGLSVFPQAPKMFVQSDQLEEQSWHQQEKEKCDVNYKPPHHGYSLDDGLNNVPIVHREIQRLIDLGIPAERIMVAGHSQGGSMVYLSAMKFPQRLMGAINMNGGMLGWWKTKELMHVANEGLPMLWVRGTQDDIVPQAHQDEIMPALKEAGFPVQTTYFNGGHDLFQNPEVIMHASNFINQQLAMHTLTAGATQTATATKIKKEVLKPGDGKTKPKLNYDAVEVDYESFKEDGTQIESLSHWRVRVGGGHVITCWEKLVPTMTLGEKAKFTCPPDSAYGSNGYKGRNYVIEPDTTVIYVVHLVKILANEFR